MHEISLCEGILKILEDNARDKGYDRVKTVWLEIGALSGVEAAAMRFGFEAVMKGSLAEGATLEIDEIPGRAWCMSCDRSVTVRQRYDACGDCGGYGLHVTGGNEMRIKELEVD